MVPLCTPGVQVLSSGVVHRIGWNGHAHRRDDVYVSRKRQPSPKPKRRPTFIRAWRQYRNLSLENLAERIGTTHASLSRMERGLQPVDTDALELLADALMCDRVDLLMRDPSDPEGMWSIWDNAKPAERRQAVELFKVLVGDKRRSG